MADPSDPRIAHFIDLREAELVRRRGLFIAEGELVVRTLLEGCRFEPLEILLSEKKARLIEEFGRLRPPGVPLYVAAQPIMDRIVGFPIHRGCLATGRIRASAVEELPLDSLYEPSVVVVAEGITNHDNIGGIFRVAQAFGVDAVLLDPVCADPMYRKAIRTSIGSILRVPFARIATAREALATLRARGYLSVALTPRRDAEELSTLLGRLRPARAALLLGTEGTGLSDEVLETADHRARIGMEPSLDSLNVATACGIALYALRTLR